MRKNLESIYNVVLGTAGHIDHGKSSLVRRLTGVDPDRLPEEQARGLTIDLGFAPLRLPDGRVMGIVDVPGHERLVKNMVAGATGIDLVVLVVAADDSVMPQTLEHLTIMQILGIERGFIAVTKTDLVEDDLRELVIEEIRETVAGTFLEGATIVEVSSATGEGFDRLLEVIVDEIAKVRPRASSGAFRMPIQRVFSPKGFGTVVTGIPISGATQVGATLEILPLGKKGRVRGIQAYKEATDLARAGHSTALNLSDIDYAEVHRGMIVAEPDYFRTGTMLEARLRYLPSTRRALAHQTRVRLHSGTAEVLGRVFLLEGKRIEPGQETFVQFRLDEPIAVAPGDRYIVRLHSPMETIGGGEILGLSKHRLKSDRPWVLEQMEIQQAAVQDAKQFLLSVVDAAGFATLTDREIALRSSRPLAEIRSDLDELVASGELIESAKSAQYFTRRTLERAKERTRALATSYFAKNPRRLLMERSRVKQELDATDPFLQVLVAELERSGEATLSESGELRWRDYGPKLSDADRRVQDAARERCRAAMFTPPSPAELAAEERVDPDRARELFDLLAEEGELVHVGDGVYLHRDAVAEAKARLTRHLEANESISASDARNLLESTRKFCIPFLEYLDRIGFTTRRGDVRVLRG